MPDSFASLIERFAGRRVLVVGDVMLDEYLYGDVERISPEAPVPVVRLSSRTFAPGGAANVAANITSIGGSARLVGVLGDDPSGETLRAIVSGAGIEADGILRDPARPTIVKTRVVARQQHVVRVDHESSEPLSPAIEDDLIALARASLSGVDAVLLSDYAKGVVSERVAQGVIDAARGMETPVVVDPKGVRYERYRGATVVTPNVHEAAIAVGSAVPPTATVADYVNALKQLLPGTAILVTQGAAGMTLFEADRPPLEIRAKATSVFDVTGAGDTVASAVALSVAAGAPLAVGVAIANIAAGLVVRKIGTTTVSAAELQSAMASEDALAVWD